MAGHKPIIVSEHAFDRIHERYIAREDVEMTIWRPDFKTPARHGKMMVRKRLRGRHLIVFYKETKLSYIFVTAYWRRI